ncbi:MAG: ABC transporter ATP-binding protein [Erysipelotrichaceae bacterium]|nr:ABC transporter ATP-binding protein [Erysipelotrichaceae bacterium]
MAQIEQETVIISYEGKLYSRLFAYMKPYLKRFALALVLVLATTAISLYQPSIVSTAIDDYIGGYGKPYGIVTEADDTAMEYNGRFYTKTYDETATQFAQILSYKDQYYFFDKLDAESLEDLQVILNGVIENAGLKENTLTVYSAEGKAYTGYLLDQEELKILRFSDNVGIRKLAIIYVIIMFAKMAVDSIRRFILLKTGQDIVFNIRNDLFRHVHSLPLRFFDTHAVGQIDTRITNDVESLNNMYTNVLVNLFSNIVMIIGYAVVMIRLNMKMAMVGFICLPVVFTITYFMRKLSRRIYRIIRTKVSQLNIFLSEHLSGMRLIQIFAREKAKYRQFSDSSDDLHRSRMSELLVFAVFFPMTDLISNIALALIVYYGGLFTMDGTITVGIVYLFTSYIRSFFRPIMQLAEQFSTLQNAFASAEKIFTLMDEKNTITEIADPIKPEKIRGKIEFRNVWFAYENEDYVLKDVSFTINPGEKVAFVGATGAGKSSILNLIGRYYDIQKGEILIDGIDIRKMSIEQIRSAIGQVQQDVFIFTGDVKGNIRLLNEEITLDQIREAARAVNAEGFIESLPDKYDEQLTERGTNLSFGQRQLLSFARTLVIDPTILVMDEATANIDTETEQLIQQALETLMKNRTTIMVAHRLSTIQHADNIIVLHHGEIMESGTHQQLLANDGIYRKLYELQKYAND